MPLGVRQGSILRLLHPSDLIGGQQLRVNVVISFQVEEAWTHMATDVGLVVVEAKTLATPFSHLCQR